MHVLLSSAKVTRCQQVEADSYLLSYHLVNNYGGHNWSDLKRCLGAPALYMAFWRREKGETGSSWQALCLGIPCANRKVFIQRPFPYSLHS